MKLLMTQSPNHGSLVFKQVVSAQAKYNKKSRCTRI